MATGHSGSIPNAEVVGQLVRSAFEVRRSGVGHPPRSAAIASGTRSAWDSNRWADPAGRLG